MKQASVTMDLPLSKMAKQENVDEIYGKVVVQETIIWILCCMRKLLLSNYIR